GCDGDAARLRRACRVGRVVRDCAADRAVRVRGFGGTREVPPARGGHRAMSGIESPWIALPVALLLVAGGLLALVGSLGLVRLRSFQARMHGPSMGNTLGLGCLVIATIVVGSAVAQRPVLHALLITVFVVMTSPVTA